MSRDGAGTAGPSCRAGACRTTGARPAPERRAIEDLLRELAPQVLAVLLRHSGGLDRAEDAVQEALIAAARHWPADGIPDSPRAWLIQVAGRKLTDQIRSEQARRRRETAAAVAEPPDMATGDVPQADDTLILLLMCCHPVLTPASAIPLTLRAAGGLSTAEIAAAFLVTEATMAQRISRAKQRIKTSGVPFQLPGEEERAERMRSVLHVLYLIFSEGYTSTAGPRLHRRELSTEAIRLARMLHTMLPDDGSVTGLLALMLLTEARRPARTGPGGELVPLSEQDRSRWDGQLITEGVALAVTAWSQPPVGDYQLQAAIAALHDEAVRAADTDWRQIHSLYLLLERLTGNPVVTLNKAVATAMVRGPAVGLAALESLDDRLQGHYRLDAVRAHLLDMLGDTDAALACYEAAARATMSLPERNYLITKAARLRQQGQPPGSDQPG